MRELDNFSPKPDQSGSVGFDPDTIDFEVDLLSHCDTIPIVVEIHGHKDTGSTDYST